jgi:hypothetical protein
MVSKRLVDAARRRRVPRQFSWVDQRLVRDGHIGRCSHGALALYLFLVTVCDAEGLSYYAEKSLCARLNMSADALREARDELLRAGLIAYEHPLYQVVALDPQPSMSAPPRAARRSVGGQGETVSIGQVLHTILPACAGTADRGGAR